MASYTDDPRALGTFNPYIQQLPIEAMKEVGMYKQQQYNEGIQKIQTNIDNIAGLDVIRGVDKKHLQSKLNELGNNLRTVAAGDFSDFQLVNSTSGMVNQIAKDKHVVSAVSNSARYRKELANMEEAIKKGESSPSNEYIFNQDSSAWLNSDDINTNMNARYNKYTNWKKNAIDVIKSLTKSENISDNAFTTDKNGNLVIADALIRTKMAGIPPEQIQQALRVGLSPSDFKQMEIDGRYTYANADPNSLLEGIKVDHVSDVRALTNKRNILQNSLASTTSATEKERITDQVKQMDDYIGRVNGEYEAIASKVENGEDLEGIKANLYTTKQMNGFAKAFSHTETSQTYENSPLAEKLMQREIKAQDWKKFILTSEQNERFHKDKMAIDLADLETKKEANRLKAQETEGYGGFGFTVPQENLPQYTLDKKKAEILQIGVDLKAADTQFLQTQGKDQAWLDQQEKAWLERPGSVDPKVAYHFNKTSGARRSMEADIKMVTDINNKITAAHGDIYKHIPSDIRGLNVTLPNGSKMALEPRDFVDFNQNFDRYKKLTVTSTGGMYGSGSTSKMTYNVDKAKQELSPKQYYLFDLYRKRDSGGAKALSTGERHILDRAQEIKRSVNEPYRKVYSAIQKDTADELTKRLTIQQGMEYSIPTATAAQKTTIASGLTSLANIADSQGGGIPNSPQWDSKTARVIALDGDARYNFSVVEGTSMSPAMYEMTVTGSKGEVVKARITPEQKRKAFGNMFEAAPEVQAIRPYQEQLRKMGGYSTALGSGPTTVANAYLNKTDFPNTSIYGVTGNIESPDGGQSYSVRLNIYDPSKGKWVVQDLPYPATGLVNEKQLGRAMQGLSDAAIYEMLYHTPATSKSLNQVKNSAKKPL